MSTQNSDFPAISFSITQPFQNIRLLELPEELLDIIAKFSNADNNEALYFKSSSASDGKKVNDEGKEGHLHLCTNDRVWLVKQVSTSNSVYVAQPSTDTWDDDVLVPDPNALGAGITAFAKPTNLLELHPVPVTSYEHIVKDQLAGLIPSIDVDTQIGSGQSSTLSVKDLHDHITAPKNAITRVLAQQCVIELPWTRSTSLPTTEDLFPSSRSGSYAYIPTLQLLLETWKQIVEVATMTETNISGDMEADTMLDAFCEADEQLMEKYKAIAKTMFAHGGYFEAIHLITKATSMEEQDQLNDMDMARWVGNLILRVHEQQKMEKADFEQQWDNAVPASWVKYCSAEVLGHACAIEQENGTETVAWREFDAGPDDKPVYTQEAGTTDGKPPAAVTAKGKRKWHEKFAASRKVKR